MPTIYRIAIVGCGGIARSHAQSYLANAGLQIVAGVDVREESAKKFAAEFSVPATYSDYREMLLKEKPDIVSICTWPSTHAQITVAAAESGVQAVLCEKPMCENLGEADAMIAACQKSGAKLVIGHQHRFDPRITKARELIAAGAIGQPTLIHRRTSGGLTNNGTHYVDMMRYLLSDPATEWVMAQVGRKTDRYERGHRIEDVTMALITFAGGARGVLEVDLPQDNTPNALIYGSAGIIDIGRDALRLMNPEAQNWQDIPTSPLNEHTAQAAELLAWMEGRSEHRGNAFTHGRATIEILMMIYESARRRDVARAPLTIKASPLELAIDEGTLPVIVEGKYDIRAPQG
jgi:predicted dehydrogenase